MGDGKAKSVIDYLDNLVEKGKATRGAIVPLKVAFVKVLQTIDGDQWQETEVRSIDVEDYMSRFANLTMGRYSHDSLVVYKSRVNKVINWYIQFLDKPGWTPDVQRRNRLPKPITKQDGGSKERTNINITIPDTNPVTAQSDTVARQNAADRIDFPFPLLDGQLIHISLPFKLTKADARRIAAFIESIAVEDGEGSN